jgi:miniconductance mechanosensitive channel
MEQKSASLAGQLVMLGLLVIIAYTAYRVAWYLMRKLIIPLIQKSKTKFDDLLLKHYFFRKISFLVPALILYYYLNDVLYLMPGLTRFLITLINIFFVFITILIIDSILSTVNDYYERFEIAKDHPIKSVIQIIKIIVYFIGLLVVIGILFERDLSSLLISLGTLSAVLMLIFRDPILGFVGGLQLVFNKMIKIGDWITVPNFAVEVRES